MNEFVLIDAAIWRGLRQFDALTHTANATPLYADLASASAKQYGPWLFDADEFKTCVPGDEPLELPWRYGVSRVFSEASLASLAMHLESQRSIAMAEGDRYFLRFADTRALDALARVLTTKQITRLKGPVTQWHYLDRFGDEKAFGRGLPADEHRHAEIVLSDEQCAALLEQALAGALADALAVGGAQTGDPHLSAGQYRHVEASAAFVLLHGIEPFEVQRHVAAAAVQTDGSVLTDARFLKRVESLRASTQWSELVNWHGDTAPQTRT